MRIIITEQQNEELKRYFAIKNIVDSFEHPGLVKTEFNVEYNYKFGFYEIVPTFYMKKSEIPRSEVSKLDLLKMLMRNDLCQRIEDYLGIHITSPRGHYKWVDES